MPPRTARGSPTRVPLPFWQSVSFPVPHSRRSWTDVGLAGAALVVGVAAESRSYSWNDTRHWLPDLITGWTLIGCGVIARGRAGLLLAAAGLGWYAGNFSP